MVFRQGRSATDHADTHTTEPDRRGWRPPIGLGGPSGYYLRQILAISSPITAICQPEPRLVLSFIAPVTGEVLRTYWLWGDKERELI